MSEFAPWTESKTSRPGSSAADVRAAAVRSLTQQANATNQSANSAVAEGPTPHRPVDRAGGLLGSTGPRSGRRGSTATALVTGTADTAEGWTMGTVPSHVELILLSDEDFARSPQQTLRSSGGTTADHTPPTGRAAPSADGLPVLSPTNGGSGPLLSRQSARSGTTVQTASHGGPLPSLNGTMGSSSPRRTAAADVPPFGGSGTAGKPQAAVTGRRAVAKGKPRRRGPASAPEPESERFVVPRAIAHQIEQLRQLAWTGGGAAAAAAAPGAPGAAGQGPSPRGRPGDAGRTATSGRAAAAAAAATPGGAAAEDAGVPMGPPRVLPTVRLSPPRRDRSPPQQHPAALAPVAARPLGLAGVSSYGASQQLDALGWYRTEVAMLREQE